jgi:6-pyruvoyl-tetrahydropterin synthase-like protein
VKRNRINDTLYGCAGVLLLGVVVFGMIRPLLSLGRYLPLDPNEGWNAYFAAAAIHGGVLYPAADALITNNYPPLSFYLVGAVGLLVGDNIFAGRIIALLSLIFVAWSIYYWLRSTGTATRFSVLAALTFLAYAVTYARDYVAMNDPQWLAHALMMAGLLVVWKSEGNTRRIILGAALMMAAGWTKHLLIPVPLTVSLWLLWRSRPDFVRWAASAGFFLALFASLAWWLYGPRMFESLHEPREYMRWKAIAEATAALRCFAPPAILWMLALVQKRPDERLAFVSTYLVISGVVALFAAGGAGVDVNSFFDALIALCLAVGLALETLSVPRERWSAAVAGGLAICLVTYLSLTAKLELRDITHLESDERTALQDIKIIRMEGHGHAACEMLDLCYWAQSAFTMDFFYFGQRIKTGVLPRTACADAFEHGDITLVQLEPNPRWRAKLLPNDCDALILHRYRPIHESNFGPLLARPGVTASR